MSEIITMSEILAPAGNAECADAAIRAGGDAIYLGYSSFSARANAENFNSETLEEIIAKAHFSGVKVYVAMNTLVKDEETEKFIKTLLYVWHIGADAIIMQDIFLGRFIHECYPDIVLHLSTQAGICNPEGARLAKECGFSRVILARETPLSEIGKISSVTETEAFIQGALCTCFSGQCYFSSFVGGNSGNRGRCKQPCRKLYSYDRANFKKPSYALSLSDLCVAENIEKLRSAGVSSFKIEGRMRRPEYVAAAVRYYRALIDGKGEKKEEKLSDLRRAYNRGNYTKGLSFGQDNRLLSSKVQGHIGEKVGTVEVLKGKYFVNGAFRPTAGDAFKVLRNGFEVGGASFEKTDEKGFFISAKTRLLDGDEVFVTTDVSANRRALSEDKRVSVSLKLRFREGERAVVEGGGVCVYSEEILPRADSRPLTKEEIEACFLKTDGLPLSIVFQSVELEGSVFLAKSRLNALRRSFYEELRRAKTKICRPDRVFEICSAECGVSSSKGNEKTAVIASAFSGLEKIDIAVLKPDDYSAPLPEGFLKGTFEKYLYYPAFTTEKDLKRIASLTENGRLDGIYAENYGGICFAAENRLKLFAGTGFNLTNKIAVSELLKEGHLTYYAISKELSEREQSALCGDGAFVLSSGDVKLMDLCYCPFGKKCAECDRKRIYNLTDESGRRFPVRRYRAADGSCRFEVYNCAELIGTGLPKTGRLIDCTVSEKLGKAVEASENEEAQKELYGNYTFGHRKRSVL